MTEITDKEKESLEKEINDARNSLSTDRLDMTFGEIISMYERDEIIINPDFQRLFRWNNDRQTKFIESLLLGIPIPPIFVAEIPGTGQWELIDGLQRVSTVISFFGKLEYMPEKNDWILSEGGLIKGFSGYSCIDLPLKYQLNIRRSVCRIEIIKWNSKVDMRYEIFNRLNTLGEQLSEQELRNCIFRPNSDKFNSFLKKLADIQDFTELTDPTEDQIEKLYLQELILRFFSLYDAAKSVTDSAERIKENISQYMTNYMKEVVQNNNFDYMLENLFNRVIKILMPIGRSVFRGNKGPFSPNIYDIVMVGIALNIDYYEKMPIEELKRKIEQAKKDEDIRKVIGSGASSKARVAKRVEFAKEFFNPD